MPLLCGAVVHLFRGIFLLRWKIFVPLVIIVRGSCLDGTYRMKVEAGTQSGTMIRLRGKGLPSINGYGGTGDLYVKIIVWVPKKLNKEDKEIIESLKNRESFKPNPSKEDKSFFDRLKDLF